MICYNIIKLISILDIIAHNFHFYVAFCSPWWKLKYVNETNCPDITVMADVQSQL